VQFDGAISQLARAFTVWNGHPGPRRAGSKLGFSSLETARHRSRKFLWILVAVLPHLAIAHPVDEIVQGAYLTLAPGEVRLELDVTPGSKVAGAVLKSLDANADKTVTDAEARAYAGRVLAQSTLALDGVTAPWTLDRVSAPPYQNLQTGNGVLKIYAVAKRPDRAGARTMSYQNRYQPAKSQCIANVFLQPAAGWVYQVTGQQRSDDGRQLVIKYTAGRS
jgi:hypothetical protein